MQKTCRHREDCNSKTFKDSLLASLDPDSILPSGCAPMNQDGVVSRLLDGGGVIVIDLPNGDSGITIRDRRVAAHFTNEGSSGCTDLAVLWAGTEDFLKITPSLVA